jgi:hypothetical protein
VIPVIAAVAIVYTLWVNVYPIQPGAYAVLPWVALGWFVIPVVAVVAIPRIAREISAGLATDSIPQEPACRPFG